MRGVMRSLASVLGGLALLSAAVVLPDGLGRTEPAVAEVIHDEVDTTGFVHLAVDCDRATPGTQSHCVTLPGPISVDVTIANSEGVPHDFCCFWLDVATDETILDPTQPVYISPNIGGNPDANEALLVEWQCDPVAPNPDVDPDPNVARSHIHCGSGSQPIAIVDPTNVTLAAVHYMAVSPGVAEVALTRGELANEVGLAFRCTPRYPEDTLILCIDATIEVVAPAGDYDGDGVANGVDNCLTVANADQTNTDGNFISNAPLYVVHDATRANSDNIGNACGDGDFDNDGIANGDEAAGCNGSGALDPLMFDTDGDRVFDGAECDLGTNPASAASKPTAAQCGATTDVDGDRLMERIELCNYNTDPAVADTDGDGRKDGCEAVSINGDLVVNSADQLLFSQEHIRVLGGGVGLPNLDLNKDGNYNSLDQLLMAFLIIPSGQCP